VREVALGLVDLGIEPGDRVSILSHTRPEWTYACFATFAAGAIVVSIYQGRRLWLAAVMRDPRCSSERLERGLDAL
jgi:acyl-CoA synthetase (AMP-forming)/AMP-acid ligase II